MEHKVLEDGLLEKYMVFSYTKNYREVLAGIDKKESERYYRLHSQYGSGNIPESETVEAFLLVKNTDGKLTVTTGLSERVPINILNAEWIKYV